MQRNILLIIVLLAIGGFFYFDAGQYLSLDFFNSQKQAISEYQQAHPLFVALVYFVIYVAVTAFSLPGAAVMTLVGGALFGLGWGLLIVSFASTIGASLAFLIARGLLRDWVQQRLPVILRRLTRG